jgi:hypothetical protein
MNPSRKQASTRNALSALAVFMIVGISALVPAVAQNYKCTDAGGKTLYQDKPCPGSMSGRVVADEQRPVETEEERRAKLEVERLKLEADVVKAKRELEETNAQNRRAEAESRESQKNAMPPSPASLAEQCVNLYRPLMIYNNFEVLGSSIDGPAFPEIKVRVRGTLATLVFDDRDSYARKSYALDYVQENLICSLEPNKTTIDRRGTQRYLDDYANRVRR